MIGLCIIILYMVGTFPDDCLLTNYGLSIPYNHVALGLVMPYGIKKLV